MSHMRLALLPLATLLPVAFLLTVHPLAAGAQGPCGEPGYPGVIPISSAAYIDVRGPNEGVWVYEESNGLSGLQRGGSSPIVPGDADACFDDSARGPDLLVF